MNNIRKHILLLCGITIGSGLTTFGQQVANPSDNRPASPPILPNDTIAYPGFSSVFGVNKYNYIRTQVPDEPSTTFPPQNNYYRQTAEYFDGLGRPLQTVARNAHADGFDIISHKAYDAGTGKETYTYLPFVTPVATSDGNMENPALTRIKRFYNVPGRDEQPYSKVETDGSPLGRVTKVLSPGRSWVGSNRGATTNYLGNTAGENVRIFTIGNTPTDVPVTTAAYAANELSVTKVTDEDGKYSMEYTDKRGLLVLKKTWVSGTGTAHDGFACTYYVYDNLQRLRYVIPPKAVATIAANWNVAAVPELCFSYFYDAKGRLIEKKIPGKGKQEYVYDNRDRQVLYQDGNLRANSNWLFTAYDALDRPLFSGIYYTTNEPRSVLQGFFTDGISYPDIYLIHYLKDYKMMGRYPTSPVVNTTILQENYYDNYDQVAGQGLDFDPSQFTGITLPAEGTVVPSILSNHIRGLATGTKVSVKDPDNVNTEIWLKTANYYDDKGRVIQTKAENLRGGVEISSNIYYFQGMLWKNILRHQNPDAQAIDGTADGPHTTFKLQTTSTLNLQEAGGSDQVKSITQRIDNGIEYQFANYFYDHLGRNVVKQTPAVNTLHEYNVRGFLHHINVGNTFENVADSNHIFEENIYYDKGFLSKLYNGNISGITWRKAGNTASVEAYGYSYDNLDRLTHAEYRRKTALGLWQKDQYDYTASNITYDGNGNLQTMNQQGIDPPAINTPIPMDQLSYTYAANSNKLIKVTDGIPAANTQSLPDFKDNNNALTEEYTYDDNGNMVYDDNKKATVIYNYLDKPERIDVEFKGHIVYVYDAQGNRLQKRVFDKNTNITDTFDYIGNFVYKNNTLQYILNSEGRARPVPGPGSQPETKFKYDYFVKDHLGNVRSTVMADPIDAQYLASHEIGMANVEQLLFDNIPNVRDAKPGGGGMAARLDGGDASRRVGTAMMLKVMPGDRFTISADAYYEGDYQQSEVEGAQAVIESLASALLGGQTYDGIPLSELPDNVRTITQTLNNPALAGQLENLVQSTNNNNAPRAHLNILFFNDKMELIEGGSSVTQVPAVPQGGFLGGFITLTPNAQSQYAVGTQPVCCTSPGPGYVLVYVDNQSIGKDVWFDNIMIEHYTGRIQEEDHYYPFGLTVQTWDDPNHKEQPYKLTTKELERNFDLNMYDFGARMYDPAAAHWLQVDPKAEKMYSISPFAYNANNPVLYVDLDGKFPYKFHIRSFISTATTGGGAFRGDGRGASLSTTSGTTSRVRTTFVVDASKGSISRPQSVSDPTVFFGGNGVPPIIKQGNPKSSIEPGMVASNFISFDFSHTGKDPITPKLVTPALDVHAHISVGEDAAEGSLGITGQFKGDKFPSTEAFVVDPSGQKLFLGAKMEDGGVTDLFGDNKQPLFNVDMTVQIDKDGNFKAVYDKNARKYIDIQNWNKQIEKDFSKTKSN